MKISKNYLQLYGPGYPEATLSQRQLYRSFIYENVVPVGRVKVNPTRLFVTLIVKCANILLSLSFPWSSDHSVFCRVNFLFFATKRVYEEKLSRLPGLGSIMSTSLFSLFYVTGEFHRFLHRGRA